MLIFVAETFILNKKWFTITVTTVTMTGILKNSARSTWLKTSVTHFLSFQIYLRETFSVYGLYKHSSDF